MELTRSLGLYSDWDPCVEKVIDFGSLIEAAARVLPPGGSIETGVYRGGTSGPLIVCASPDSFHLSIDPFGLPSQSYSELTGDYGAWTEVRKTLARLAELGLERSVTYCHYLMASAEFVSADLLSHHQSSFRIVHLDGAHTKEAVVDELAYFRRRLPGPSLFILDDHDTNFPGVEEAVNSPAGVGLGTGSPQVLQVPRPSGSVCLFCLATRLLTPSPALSPLRLTRPRQTRPARTLPTRRDC